MGDLVGAGVGHLVGIAVNNVNTSSTASGAGTAGAIVFPDGGDFAQMGADRPACIAPLPAFAGFVLSR